MAGKDYGRIEVKKDCQMYNKTLYGNSEGGCSGLNELYCKKEKCKFYKSKYKPEQK